MSSKNPAELFNLKLIGNSMRPFLKPGMEIKLCKIGLRQLPAVGDVAAIRCRNGILVHRILRIRWRKSSREYFTKGDWRLTGDGWIEEDRIMGIMVREKRHQKIIDLTAAGFSFWLWCVGKLLRRRKR